MLDKNGFAIYTKKEQREIATSAARAYLRRQGIDPMTTGPESGLAALDDLLRLDEDTIAAQWYKDASENQFKLFKRGWRAWRKKRCRMMRITRKLNKGDISALDDALEFLEEESTSPPPDAGAETPGVDLARE